MSAEAAETPCERLILSVCPTSGDLRVWDEASPSGFVEASVEHWRDVMVALKAAIEAEGR